MGRAVRGDFLEVVMPELSLWDRIQVGSVRKQQHREEEGRRQIQKQDGCAEGEAA